MALPPPDTIRRALSPDTAGASKPPDLPPFHLRIDAPAVSWHICTSCRGCSAYVYCEICSDAFCSSCWSAVHRGPLAKHSYYLVQQPEGIAPDAVAHVEGTIPGAPPPPDKTVGMVLVAEVAAIAVDAADAAASAAAREAVAAARAAADSAEMRLLKSFNVQAAAEATIKISDVGAYIRRRTRLGTLCPTLQRRVTMPRVEDTRHAVEALVSHDTIHAAGGIAKVKVAPPDPWSAGVARHGGGVKGYFVT